MKQKLRLFAIHQTATSLQRTNNLNPRTRWYPALDESNRMKSAYFTIHLGKNPPPQNGCRLKSVFFLKHRFHIFHFPNSTGLFTKPTGHHYTKHRFSPDIGDMARTFDSLSRTKIFLGDGSNNTPKNPDDLFQTKSRSIDEEHTIRTHTSQRSFWGLAWLGLQDTGPRCLLEGGVPRPF